MKRIIHYENSFSKSSNTNHVFTIYIKTWENWLADTYNGGRLLADTQSGAVC